MTRLYGRAPCGKRLVEAVPRGHWKTSTFIGALRCDGLTATGVFDGPDQWRSMANCSSPMLNRFWSRRCGQVMLSFWTTCARTRVAGVREAIEGAGASL